MVNTKSLVKTLIVSTSISSLLIATTPLALADSAGNSTTGADSTNIAKTETSNDTDISQTSIANITNTFNITANTGGNEANKNTGDANITTGNITGSLTINNDVNSNSISPSVLCCGNTDPSSSSNSKTGGDSKNISKVEIENNLTINQKSYMRISNGVNVDLNTGNNEANKNTGDANINTGDITFAINIGNNGNTNTVGNPPSNPGSNPPPPGSTRNPPGTVLAATGGLPVTGGSLPFAPIAVLIILGILLRSYEREWRERALLEN
ncbi:MAG: hypothetical protein A3F35_00675 [Candidatus Woykebacteria bacterium RIFCSPHIGHO2_12_FULL_45_10]|uniref:Gram-positive cocci surface proteins LPxTG domain-containing protein n=1 Tax=Candidatus Woykebacteria bacterium RIFCSPHIGHO2_12_FULL_45_10 TaxID=1802603 RepID=A0A1G1WNI9_9BACT|nr:MAG: hypothetical protein A3F35_00675 [Candidatus Woykebacteria bacterium RIFCSPHIGHO2_12_FULL_45_10]